MPRPAKPARLWLRPARGDRDAIYVILDRGKEISTGCGAGDIEGAQRALAKHIEGKRDPANAIRESHPNQILIADAVSLYIKGHVKKPGKELARPKAIQARLDSLLEFFGEDTVAEVTGARQEEYAAQRSATIADDRDMLPHECQSAPRRELEDLSAAINFAFRKRGGASVVFRPTLPDDVDPRQRWLTRSEAAALIWSAWRGGNKHIARFCLVALYTGSRSGDILNAAMMPTIGAGHVNLEINLWKRKPDNKRETNKRQPEVPLPIRLRPHVERWHRLGIARRYLIEYQGKPVKSFKTAWPGIVKAAGLATDDSAQKVLRHTLRHTGISWMLRAKVAISDVSDYAGVSETVIRRVYKHHLPGTFDALLEASHRFGRTAKMER